ncbi:putative Aluminum activated malate transporter family protein [Quillaja saponaria]|uniref:Aluminum activated malate transporter family protein n=1 Tax=Quillaja saponaria TaxID=32244 RepID=A0AAD7VMA0_QUISA|nr:putative Aluminum activated malate transporter family protein [Quillaja saponaria]
MGLESASQEKKACLLARAWDWLKALPKSLLGKLLEFGSNTKKIGQDDPRKVIHSVKVGVALTLVSLFYYCQPLFDSFGVSVIWAVMTVVVVFEFSVGATLGKGFNRGMATLLAGALGVGAHHLACLSGHIGEPILLGLFVFVQATTATFIRFFPKIKERYDYGMLIFVLTFSLISVSGFRDDEILKLAKNRLSTILIGASACIIITIVVFPVWAGEDFHNLIANNLEKLGSFLEAFEGEYFKASKDGNSEDNKSLLEAYKSVLSSKNNEESLANFARWEPGHGRFQFRHPWKQYLNIGALTRQCAYRIEALNGHLNTNTQVSQEILSMIQDECTQMCSESSKALKELALAVKTMTKPSLADTHIANSKAATKNLKSLFQSNFREEANLLAVIPATTVASLLVDVVDCTEKIADSVNKLASEANFKSIDSTVSLEESQLQKCEPAHSEPKTDSLHVVIIVG